jgi:hypothetical protein
MTLDLGNGNSITLNTFHNKLWITLRSNGGGITVAADPDAGQELGLAAWREARRLKRGERAGATEQPSLD